MKVKDAHKFLDELMDEGFGDLEMFTEYRRVERMDTAVADTDCDGSSTELELGDPYVYVQLGN